MDERAQRVVGSFAAGVMDRIRDHCRELDPEGWANIDAAPVLDDLSRWVAARHRSRTDAALRARARKERCWQAYRAWLRLKDET